ncbi:MAG: hypothetical protein V1847_03200 [Candidatus Diapherotrites archaeon]
MREWKKLWAEESASSEFSSLYMLIVFMIAALLLIALIKPQFRKSQQLVSQTTGTTGK